MAADNGGIYESLLMIFLLVYAGSYCGLRREKIRTELVKYAGTMVRVVLVD